MNFYLQRVHLVCAQTNPTEIFAKVLVAQDLPKDRKKMYKMWPKIMGMPKFIGVVLLVQVIPS